MRFFKLGLICLITISGCGKTERVRYTPSESVEFLQGDPLQLVQDRDLNQTSMFSQAAIPDLSKDFYLESTVSFFQAKRLYRVRTISSAPDIKDGNRPPKDQINLDIPGADHSYVLQELKETDKNFSNFPRSEFLRGRWFVYHPRKSSDPRQFEFFFLENFLGELQIARMGFKGGLTFEVTPQHYSKHRSGNAMSILFSVNAHDFGTNGLIQATFVRKMPAGRLLKTADLSTVFYYLFGENNVVNWPRDEKGDRDIEIRLCLLPSQASERKLLEGILKKSMSDWNVAVAGGFSLVKYKGHDADKAGPPFSDLNTRCVYLVDDYRTEHRPKFLNPAATYMHQNPFIYHLIDTDILIYRKEIEKDVSKLEKYSPLQRTITHEMGHVLGLHHQFDGVPSIMSYEKKASHNMVTDEYDKPAIKALYAD